MALATEHPSTSERAGTRSLSRLIKLQRMRSPYCASHRDSASVRARTSSSDCVIKRETSAMTVRVVVANSPDNAST